MSGKKLAWSKDTIGERESRTKQTPAEDVIGGLSAIVWSLTLLPLIKYVCSFSLRCVLSVLVSLRQLLVLHRLSLL